MKTKQIKLLIFDKAGEIRKLEKLQCEIYAELLKELNFKPKNLMDDDALWDYCFNHCGKIDEVVNDLVKL